MKTLNIKTLNIRTSHRKPNPRIHCKDVLGTKSTKRKHCQWRYSARCDAIPCRSDRIESVRTSRRVVRMRFWQPYSRIQTNQLANSFKSTRLVEYWITIVPVIRDNRVGRPVHQLFVAYTWSWMEAHRYAPTSLLVYTCIVVNQFSIQFAFYFTVCSFP